MRKAIFLIFFIPLLAAGQSWKENPVSVRILNNATLLPPASLLAPFNQPIHPGLAVSYEFGWKEKNKHKWFQDVTLGYTYHRFAFQSILLYTTAGYRYQLKRFFGDAGLEAGYMHSWFLTDRSVLQDDGTYKSGKGLGKPQFIAGAGFKLGCNVANAENPVRIFVGYDIRIQMPFVQSYVPMLPNGTVSIGAQFKLK